MTGKKNLPTLYQVTIWKTGKNEHEQELSIYGFETIADAWECFYEKIEEAEKFFGEADGCVYTMSETDVERLYGWKF